MSFFLFFSKVFSFVRSYIGMLHNMDAYNFWRTRDYWSCPPLLWWVGILSLLVYAACRVLWPSVGGAAETLAALLGLVAVMVYGKQQRGSAALWLLLCAVGVQIISWVMGSFHHPEWVASNPKIDRLAKLFIFIAVAWWLGGSTRNTFVVWGLALLGYVLASFTHGGGLDEWVRGLQGQRVGFGIRNLQHGSMLYGVALLGLAVFASRIMAQGRFRVGRVVLWCVMIVLAITGVLIGQTRAVWLALALSLPFILVVFIIYSIREYRQRFSIGPTLLLAALCTAVVAATVFAFHEPLMRRMTQESHVLSLLLQGEFSDIPYTSVGIRINTWLAAFEWIKERPLLGWGGEARSLVIDHTPWLPDLVKENFGHLHNFFLELWLSYGLLGVSVIAALMLWVGIGTWRAWRGGILPGDIALFSAGFFIYWTVVNQFESYNSFWTGVYVHNIIVGGLVTHIWRWQVESGKRVFNWPGRGRLT